MCEDAARGHTLSTPTRGLPARPPACRGGDEPVCLTFIESIVLHGTQEASTRQLLVHLSHTDTKGAVLKYSSKSTSHDRQRHSLSLRARDAPCANTGRTKVAARRGGNSGSLPTWHDGEEEERGGGGERSLQVSEGRILTVSRGGCSA